jgi:hypothetical protein
VSFPSGVNNTLVIFGKRAAVQTLILTDDTTAPSSGHFRVRVLNLSPDSGPIDLYATTGADISSSGAVVPGATFGSVTGFGRSDHGTLRLTVTSSGTQDVLFQSPAQALTDNTTYTLVVMPSLSGKLVSVVLLTQGTNGPARCCRIPWPASRP